MLSRLFRKLVSPAAMADADRLIAAHGPGAVFLARHAALAARESDAHSHWHKVLAECERRQRRGEGATARAG